MRDVTLYLGHPAAWIEVTGADSFDFLQGQFSNDLRSPAPSPVTYGLWLDRKGKVVADSFVLQETKNRFYLYSPHSSATTIIERLEPFVIADDVTLRDLTAHTAVAVLWGDDTDDALVHAGFERPDQGSFFHWERRFLFRGRRSRKTNVELILAGDDNDETMARLSAAVTNAGGRLVDATAVERERIEAGIPSVPRDVGPADLPQEGNLEHDAISYTKGCYLGQEVMARIRSMGQVRRALAQVQLGDGDVNPPAPLYDGGREAGTLRSVAGPAPLLGLALVKRDVLVKQRKLALAPDAPSTVHIINVPAL